MYDLIARPLGFFYEHVWPSYGGAIVLLTLSIMVVLTPLTLKGTRSMLAMQRLQPELKRLQAKYKDDRPKLNEEMMKFYKENGVNPVSGCLPLLLQMPVFFLLYRTLIGLTASAPYGADMGSAVAAGTRNRTYDGFGVFHPKHLDKAGALYRDLHGTRQMRSWGVNLADSAQGALGHGIGHAAPFLVLVLLVAATSYIQQKQVSGRTPQAAQANPQQQMLLKIMPAFLAFISLGLPAGVVVYFFVSNFYRIGQQAFITRTMYGDGGILHTTATEVETSGSAEPGPEAGCGGAGRGVGAKPRPPAPEPAPARKGLLGSLGFDKAGLPALSRRSNGDGVESKVTTNGGGSKRAGAPTMPAGRPARGASARPGAANGGSTSLRAGKQAAGRTGSVNDKGANGPRPAKGTSGGRPTTAAGQAPAPSPNRSRNKKKKRK